MLAAARSFSPPVQLRPVAVRPAPGAEHGSAGNGAGRTPSCLSCIGSGPGPPHPRAFIRRLVIRPLRLSIASFRLSGDRLARAAHLRFRKPPRRPLRFPETRSAGSAVPGEPPLRSAAPLVAGCCSRGNAGTRRRLVIRPLRQAIAPFRATGHPGSSPA